MKRVANPAVFREKVKTQLFKLLKNNKYSDNLERGIYNHVLQTAEEKNIIKKWENTYFVQIYIDKFRMIHYNLQNPDIANLILDNKIKAHELAFMTHQELMPEKWNH